MSKNTDADCNPNESKHSEITWQFFEGPAMKAGLPSTPFGDAMRMIVSKWLSAVRCFWGWFLAVGRVFHLSLVLIGLEAALLTTNGADVANYQRLRSFVGTPTDGEYFFDGVIEGSDGKLYGAMVNGGPQDGGIVFRMNKDGSGYELLHSFSIPSENGISPWGTVIEGSDGNLYGATRRGGLADAGTVFRLGKDGTGFAVVRHFTTNANDGAFPLNNVIEGSDGRLYGRTLSGGTNEGSSIFGMNKDGSSYALLHSFEEQYNDHQDSYAGLVHGRDGMIYGTTYADGTYGAGSVFRLNKDGSGFQSLHDFDWSLTDGGYPYGSVAEASNGVLYGVTSGGGSDDYGILYRINRDGTGYQVLRHFTTGTGEGYLPVGAPVEGPGGLLYGTTYFGGMNQGGTIYRMRKDGTGFEFIYRFLPNSGDGFNPNATLLRGSDGALYGTTFLGPAGFAGSIFRIKPVALVGEKAGGTMNLHLEGFIGHVYAVDRTGGFPAIWTEIGQATNTTGRITFTDGQGNGGFYRARVLNP